MTDPGAQAVARGLGAQVIGPSPLQLPQMVEAGGLRRTGQGLYVRDHRGIAPPTWVVKPGHELGDRHLDGVDPAVRARGEVILTVHALPAAELRLRRVGHELRGEAAIAVAADLDLTSAHALAHTAELALRTGIERLGQVSVRVEPSAVPVAAVS
jgi:hypothetical protein